MNGVRAIELAAGPPSGDLLILGPSLGTGVEALWIDVVPALADRVRVIGWDLPGHGVSPEPHEPVSFASLAADIVAIAQQTAAPHTWYAGVSAGGAVGLQALLDHPGVFAGAALFNTGARIGAPEAWHERAEVVAALGTPSQVEASARRWFGPGFIESSPHVVTRLLATLQTAGPAGYTAVCMALAEFDMRDRLGEIEVPVLAVAGEHDESTPVSDLAFIAAHVPHGRLTVLDGVAHLSPAEAPDEVAAALLDLVTGGLGRSFDRGMAVRRAVLGDDHVTTATAHATALTAPFQELITEFAWGAVWSREGLDRRMRSAVTLTALVAGSHWGELAMHVRAARRNGLTDIEIREILLQCAVYCSVPSANHALAIASEVFAADSST